MVNNEHVWVKFGSKLMKSSTLSGTNKCATSTASKQHQPALYLSTLHTQVRRPDVQNRKSKNDAVVKWLVYTYPRWMEKRNGKFSSASTVAVWAGSRTSGAHANRTDAGHRQNDKAPPRVPAGIHGRARQDAFMHMSVRWSTRIARCGRSVMVNTERLGSLLGSSRVRLGRNRRALDRRARRPEKDGGIILQWEQGQWTLQDQRRRQRCQSLGGEHSRAQRTSR